MRGEFDMALKKNKSLGEELVLAPFWHFVVSHLFPTWLSPNAVTLTGLMSLFGLMGIIVSCDNPFSEPLPPRMCAIAALLMFFYQTCDGTDGIHARRLGKATRQGAFLDRVVDSFAVTIIPCTMAAAAGRSGWLHLDIVLLQAAFFGSNLLLTTTGGQTYNYLDAQDLLFVSIIVLTARATGLSILLPMILVRICVVWNIIANGRRISEATVLPQVCSSVRGLFIRTTTFMLQACFGLRLLALQLQRGSDYTGWICLQSILFSWFMSDILHDAAHGYEILHFTEVCTSALISLGAVLLSYAGYESCSPGIVCILFFWFLQTFLKRYQKLFKLNKIINELFRVPSYNS